MTDGTRPAIDPTLFEYYKRELNYLIAGGKAFAQLYPEEAGNLGLNERGSKDPHVERLIEAVAFQTARVQERLDRDSSRLATSIIEILLPEVLAPVPALGIAQFALPDDATRPVRVERGTRLVAPELPSTRVRCRFQTVYDLMLCPLRVSRVDLEHRSGTDGTLAVELEVTHGSANWPAAFPPKLLLYLRSGVGDGIPALLYECLLRGQAHRDATTIAVGTDAPVKCADVHVNAMGLRRHERALDCWPFSQPAHALMFDYLHYPEKFAFLEVRGLDVLSTLGTTGGVSSRVQLRLPLVGPLPNDRSAVTERHLVLGCTPVINVFKGKAAPRTVDGRQTYHSVRPAAVHGGFVRDSDQPEASEALKILDVEVKSQGEPPVRFEPFLHFRGADAAVAPRFWMSERLIDVSDDADSTPRSRLFVSLTEANGHRSHVSGRLSVNALFTNQSLVARLQPEANLTFEGSRHERTLSSARLKATFATRSRPPLTNEELWRIVAHIAMNLNGLVEGGAVRVRELARLYTATQHDADVRISRLTDVRARPVAKYSWMESTGDGTSRLHLAENDERIPSTAPVGLVRGIEVELHLNAEPRPGPEGSVAGSVDGAFLLAQVLDAAFAELVGINTFCQTTAVLTRGDRATDVIRVWPSHTGEPDVPQVLA